MSTLGSLMKDIHQKVTKETLVKVTSILDEEKLKSEVYKDFYAFVELANISADDVYYLADGVPSFFYYKYPYYSGILFFDLEDTESNFSQIKMLKKRKEFIDDALAENDFSHYLMIVEGPCDLLLFQELFQNVKGHLKYELLTDLYTTVEYGHDGLTIDMWKEALIERTSDNLDAIRGDNPILTIYRGQASGSTDVTKALSWTLRFSTALFFASRYNTDDVVLYKANVRREDVIDFFEGRNEAEVVIFPENIFNIEKLEQYSSKEVIDRLTKSRITDEFVLYRNTFILNNAKYKKLKHHNSMHAQRVLLLALTLSELLNLSDEDRSVLANFGIYHDIGRQDDKEDPKHGLASLKYLKRMLGFSKPVQITCKGVKKDYILDNVTGESFEILKWIIEYHCRPTKEAFDKLEKSKIVDKERAKKLYRVAKDSDALDRTRLNDLQYDKLRFDESKKLIVYAKGLLENLK